MERISDYIKGIKDIYYINQYGEIYSIAKTRPELLIGKTDKDGYIEYGLYQTNGKRRYLRAHRIMGAVYLGLDLDSDLVINHKNGIKNDNRLQNLEIVTKSKNALHSIYVLGNDTTTNLPDNRVQVELFDIEKQKSSIFISIRDMCKKYKDINYDYICNALKRNNGSYLYKNKYYIKRLTKGSVTTIETTTQSRKGVE